MKREQNILIHSTEVNTIRVRCGYCHWEVRLRLELKYPLRSFSDKCEKCGHDWVGESTGDEEYRQVVDVLIQYLMKIQATAEPRFEIVFEVEDDLQPLYRTQV